MRNFKPGMVFASYNLKVVITVHEVTDNLVKYDVRIPDNKPMPVEVEPTLLLEHMAFGGSYELINHSVFPEYQQYNNV